jgi:Domain of unknown function (DUF202)
MIRGFSDHASNERTFLAWVRIDIAVIALEHVPFLRNRDLL